MKIRTFLLILAVMALLGATGHLFVRNSEILRQEFVLSDTTSIPVWVTLGLGFGIGILMTLVFGLSREVGRLTDRWRHYRARRKSEEIEEEYSRGLVAVLEGSEEEALGHFRAVLERDSRHFNTLLKLGEVLRSLGKHNDAIEFHRKAQHLKEDDTRPLYALCDDYEDKGDMARARAMLGKILGINKNSVSAWRKLRSLHIKEGNWDDALEANQKAEKYSGTHDPRDGADVRIGQGIRYEIAQTRLRAGRAKDAAGILRRLLKEAPQFIPAYVLMGQALATDGQDPQGVEAWYDGFEATGSPIFLTVLEEHFLRLDNPLAAIEALKSCVARAEKDTLPRFYLGKLYFRLEMLDDAFSVLSSLEGRASYAPTLHYLLGRIHERRRSFPDAAAEYRRVIKELELVQLEYRCQACAETSMEWSDRCAQCGMWNTIEVALREEISLDALGLSPAPVYTSRHDT